MQRLLKVLNNLNYIIIGGILSWKVKIQIYLGTVELIKQSL